MRTVHRTSATLATLLLLGVVPSAAQAHHLPDDNAALHQYIASLPEPDGERPVGLDDGAKAQPLPRSVTRELASTPDGDALTQVATSVALGAPEKQPGDGRPQPGTEKSAVPAAVIEPDEGSVSTVLGSTEGILALILLAISLAVGLVVGRSGAQRA